MRIVHCDSCGKSMGRWFTITPKIEAKSPMMNVADLLCLATTKELCEDCYKNLLMKIEKGVFSNAL